MIETILHSIKSFNRDKFSEQGWGVRYGTLIMAVALILRGIMNYVYFWVAAQSLGIYEYGSFSILFSSVAIVYFVLGQSAETLLSKYIAEANSSQQGYKSLLRRIILWLLVVSIIFIIVGFIAQNIITIKLFPEAPGLFYFLIGISLLESWDMTLRGVLRGLRAIGMYAMSIIVQMFLRLAIFVLFVNVLGWRIVGAGISILIAMAISILITLFFLKYLWEHETETTTHEYPFTADILKYLYSLVLTFSLVAVYYHGGPLFIKTLAVERVNEKAGMFMLATYLSRLPLALSESLTINLLPRLSNVDMQGNINRAWRYIVRIYQFVLPACVLVVVGLYSWGPWLLQIFNKEYEYSHIGMGLLGLNVSLMILFLISAQFLLSRSKTNMVIVSWLVGCVVLIVISAFGPWPIITRLEVGYVASSALMLGIAHFSAFFYSKQS